MDAIVIVDLQRAFTPPPGVVARIRERAATFPRRVFTRFINPPGSMIRRKLQHNSCAPGTEELEFILPPGPGDLVLEKFSYGLDVHAVRRLREDGVRHVLVCGGDTDACVLGVIFSLFDGGIDCSVDPSLCYSAAGLHEPAMRIIQELFGTPRDLGIELRT
jgi:nicotinamidase-related amidase